ncbi:oligosaccharide flippase family protein [Paucilactobacillus nenjiangensis]|uniref:lipopolysaccharide biosynthesis protein n=1 Tax=Paucilactobacillus nenjiangensis TaxID=1296540 RepID=UPI0028D2CA63|nr:oligosaccharide flippase family protein [Paucilactobacillus nenjiangensis]
MKNEIKQLVFYTIGPFLSKMLSFVLLPIVSYFISVRDYGFYTLFLLLISYFQPIITLSTEQYYLRAYDSQSAVTLRNVLFRLFTLILVIGVVISLILGFVQILSTFYVCMSILALLVSYFTAVQDLYVRSLRFHNMGGQYSLITAITQMAVFISTLAIVLTFKTVWGLIYGQLIGVMASLIYTKIVLNKQMAKLEQKKYLGKFNVVLKKGLIYSLPLFPGVFLWVVQNTIGRVVISDHAYLLGIYGIGFKFATITNLFITSFILYWEPKIYQQYDKLQVKKIKKSDYIAYVNKYKDLYSTIIEFLMLSLVLILPILMLTMQKNYRVAGYILPIMILNSYIHGYDYFAGFGPQLTGKTILTIFPLLIALLLNVGLVSTGDYDLLLKVNVAANASMLILLIGNKLISDRISINVSLLKDIIKIICYNIIAIVFYLSHSYILVLVGFLIIFVVFNLNSIIVGIMFVKNQILNRRRTS